MTVFGFGKTTGAAPHGKRKLQTREAHEVLRPFEYRVLRAIHALTTTAFASDLNRYISNQIGRDVSLAQTYVALERLLNKQLIGSIKVRADDGGRMRRVFHVTRKGDEALRLTDEQYRVFQPPTRETNNGHRAQSAAGAD